MEKWCLNVGEPVIFGKRSKLGGLQHSIFIAKPTILDFLLRGWLGEVRIFMRNSRRVFTAVRSIVTLQQPNKEDCMSEQSNHRFSHCLSPKQ